MIIKHAVRHCSVITNCFHKPGFCPMDPLKYRLSFPKNPLRYHSINHFDITIALLLPGHQFI